MKAPGLKFLLNHLLAKNTHLWNCLSLQTSYCRYNSIWRCNWNSIKQTLDLSSSYSYWWLQCYIPPLESAGYLQPGRNDLGAPFLITRPQTTCVRANTFTAWPQPRKFVRLGLDKQPCQIIKLIPAFPNWEVGPSSRLFHGISVNCSPN